MCVCLAKNLYSSNFWKHPWSPTMQRRYPVTCFVLHDQSSLIWDFLWLNTINTQRFSDCIVCLFVCWLAGWLVGWLAGRLVVRKTQKQQNRFPWNLNGGWVLTRNYHPSPLVWFRIQEHFVNIARYGVKIFVPQGMMNGSWLVSTSEYKRGKYPLYWVAL